MLCNSLDLSCENSLPFIEIWNVEYECCEHMLACKCLRNNCVFCSSFISSNQSSGVMIEEDIISSAT